MLTNIRRPLALGVAGFALLALAACADDDSGSAGSPFTQALSKDYTDLASQVAAAPPPPEPDLDFLDTFADVLTHPFGIGKENSNDLLMKAFQDKADLAASGQEPAPEEAPAGNPDAQSIHARLVRSIEAGKDRFPEQTARAQADYDCWILDSAAPGMGAEAQACRAALNGPLLAQENAARPSAPPPVNSGFPVPPVMPAPAPVAAAPTAAPVSDYTVYFDFDSWTLTAEDLTVITNVINTARAGGQSRITIVGHTDTSGSADYNQKLSVKRANVVVEALVDMGARRAAIQASGVGENDLAVQTPDNTKEAKNRRAVIGLQP